MKYLRTGAWYEADNKHIDGDIAFSEMFPNKQIEEKTVAPECSCKEEIKELRKIILQLTEPAKAVKKEVTKEVKKVVKKSGKGK